MDIVCPTCTAAYEIDGNSLTPVGRKVRCAACSTIWRVYAAEGSAIDADPLAAANPYATEPEENILGEGGPMLRQALQDEASGNEASSLTSEQQSNRATEGAGLMAMEETISMQDSQQDAAQTTAQDENLASLTPPAMEEPARARFTRSSHAAKLTPGKSSSSKSSSRNFLSWQSASVVAAVLVASIGMQQRENIVRYLPHTAGLYAAIGIPVNLRGIDIRNVASRLLDDNGVSVLVIDGDLQNITRNKVDLPRLRFAVRGNDGQEVYVWSAQADKTSLQPGESLNFRRRLAAPPVDGKDVAVRFLTRADTTAGIK